MSPRTPQRVVVLLLEPVIGYDATIPPQLLGQATDDAGHALYDVRMASIDGGPVATPLGYGITPHGDASLLAEADMVIVPGTRIAALRRDGSLPEEVRSALALTPPQARLVSICTGAFVLAAAVLLDGRPATTHWAYVEEFARLYPAVRLDPKVLFTDDGDVLTSAGLSAGIDLCLHIIRADHGTEVANRVARHVVVPPWRDGGQAQFIDTYVPPRPAESTAAARAWAMEHLDERITVDDLARAATMSVRTFTRRFREETGQSPTGWLTQQRVRRAQRLLETTDLPVDDVAARSGLGSGGSLRAHLHAVAGVSPSAYRQTFRPPQGA